MQNSMYCWHELPSFPNSKMPSEGDEIPTSDYNVDTQSHDLYLHRFRLE